MRSINLELAGTEHAEQPQAERDDDDPQQRASSRLEERRRPDRAHGGQARCHQQRHEADLRCKPPWKLDAVQPVCFSMSQAGRPQDGSRPARATPRAGRTASPSR